MTRLESPSRLEDELVRLAVAADHSDRREVCRVLRPHGFRENGDA